MTTHVLAARHITVSFDDHKVLDDVDLIVRTNEVIGVTGPSGSGKTTLLRVLAGLLSPDVGGVTYDGAPAAAPGSIALVAQHPRLVCNPRWTLGQLIAEPAVIRREPVAIEAVARRVGLTAALLDRYPGQVSDGQLQRACIARVLVQRPAFVLCDEPTAMLDPIASADVVQMLREIGTYAGIALVSHDEELVDALSHSVFAL
ncbi:ABC transporter ATP-binding protein [Mycolicibacterium pulveris]|uniref:ABC transporter ATP-binding protein n=1 Tax=Mycolicibacterium pulveris TaxID=36813 RepID=UPI003CE9CAD3